MGLRASLGSSLWGLQSHFSLRVGTSAGKVSDFCDRRSAETVSELFDFCDNISWDIAAELLIWGVMFCTR